MPLDFVPPPGIRVMRVLARARHVERMLVHVEEEAGTAPAELVRALDPTAVSGIRRAIAALDRLHGTGLRGLLDVLDDGGSPAILVSHQRGRLLSALLLERPSWRAGEAVSALLPLAAALDRMHEVGVAHGALGAEKVMMTSDGPVIIEFEGAETFSPGSPEVVRESIDAVTRDRESLRSISMDVLSRVAGSRSSAAQDLLSLVSTTAASELTSALTAGLAQLAAATPVGLDDAGRDDIMPAVQSEPLLPHDPKVQPLPTSALARLLSGMSGEGPVSLALRLWAQARNGFARMSSSRRRIALAGGAAVAVAGVLLTLIPPGEDSGGTVAVLPSVGPTGEPDPNLEQLIAPGSEDDPAEAVVALLERRDECFRELSVICLDGVDQIGSAALAADRSALLDMRGGMENTTPPRPVGRARVVERLGDSALVEVGDETAPASLLVMRSEAGWRIRDWVVGG